MYVLHALQRPYHIICQCMQLCMSHDASVYSVDERLIFFPTITVQWNDDFNRNYIRKCDIILSIKCLIGCQGKIMNRLIFHLIGILSVVWFGILYFTIKPKCHYERNVFFYILIYILLSNCLLHSEKSMT